MADRDPLDMSSGQGDDDRNPLAEFMAQFGIQPGPGGTFDLEQLMGHLQNAMAQFSRQMSAMGGDGGSLNWTFAKEIAARLLQRSDPSRIPPMSAIADAVSLANLWLDQQTVLSGWGHPAAWSRAVDREHFPDVAAMLPVTASMARYRRPDRTTAADLAGLQPMLEPMMGRLAGDVVSTDRTGRRGSQPTWWAPPTSPSPSQPAWKPCCPTTSPLRRGLDHPCPISGSTWLREAARSVRQSRLVGPIAALIEHYARRYRDANAIEEALESQLQGT